MDGVIRFVSGYVWTRKLLNPERKVYYSKVSGYVWTGPEIPSACNDKNNSTLSKLFRRTKVLIKLPMQAVLKYTQDGSPDSPTRTLRKPLFGLPIVSLKSLWGWLAASFV